MASVLIVYGSSTGNTQYVAEEIEKNLAEQGMDVKNIEVGRAKAEGLCDGFDMVLLGCSTWGVNEIELQEDFVYLFDRLEEANVKGKKVAVFGCGESDRIWFCGAVDAIEKKLKELDAHVVNTLRIDGDPKEKKSVINDWANRVAANMIRTKH